MNKKEVITKENVKTMGEIIAVSCARRYCTKYYSERAKKLYDGLVYDVYHHTGDPARNYTDGYDLAMEAITFLCEHTGKSLSDTATVLKYGKPKQMTILNACFFIISQYITKQVTFTNRTKSIDDPTFVEPEECIFVMNEEDASVGWEKIDEIVIKLKLTEDEARLMDYRLSGLSYTEISRIIGCATSTAYERWMKVGKKCITAL